MQIGPHTLQNQLILAPMAGVTDRPFRSLCRRMGAGMAVAEMVSANPRLLHGRKTLLRTDHRGETGLRAIQILGNDPEEMALAAKFNADRGAHLIDINMGCPAKKVLKKAFCGDLGLLKPLSTWALASVQVTSRSFIIFLPIYV